MKIAAIALAAALAVSSAPAAAIEEFERPNAAAAILGEAETGYILYGDDHNASLTRDPDALTTFMLLLLAAETAEHDAAIGRGTPVSVSQEALSQVPAGSAVTGLVPGETLTFVDMLMCAFVGGGADAANAVAEAVSGSVGTFVALMNRRAEELGCTGTFFANPHGQNARRQRTTSRDLFLIVREGTKYELFMEVAGAVRHTVPATEHSPARGLTSTAFTLDPSRPRYYYRYALAGRVSDIPRVSDTYTNGFGAVIIAERGGMRLIAVVLGARDVTLEDMSTQLQNMTEARRMLEWGYENYSWRTVLPAAMPVARAPVRYGAGADFVNLRLEQDVRLLLRNDIADGDIVLDVRLRTDENGEPPMAPINAGDELGELTLYHDGQELAAVTLVAVNSVELLRAALGRDRIITFFRENRGIILLITFLTLAALFLAYSLLVARYKRVKRERRKRLKTQRQNNDDPR